jgi:ADP-heptose:LPS heptosyltransferase
MAFRYRLDRMIRAVVMRVMGWLTPGTTERRVDLLREDVKTILLVRGIFRMGDSILATPAILLFRENFSTARIDFVGPEEKELIGYFEEVLRERIPVVFEPNLREFASLVAACDLFVGCDSGPVHLACASRVRTVAICLQRNFDRWGPPVSLGRIVYGKSGVSAKDVIDACCCELRTLRSDDAPRKLVNA